MPVRGAAQKVLAQVREEPAGVGEPGTGGGVRAEYLGAGEGRLGEDVVRTAAGDRCLVPHVVVDDVPFAPAVSFPPDELLVFQVADRLGDGCRADPQAPDQLSGRHAASIGFLPGGEEYIIIDGGLKGQRGFFTRDDNEVITGVDIAGRLFSRVPDAS
jgi:hypothetical protein